MVPPGSEEEADEGHDHDRRERPRRDAPYAEAPSAPHLGLCLRLLVRAVHEPQHRAHTLVDQVDAERVQQQSDDGVAVDQHDDSCCHERRRAQHTQCGALRLRCQPAAGRAKRLAERARLDK